MGWYQRGVHGESSRNYLLKRLIMMFLILAALSAVTLGQDTYYCPDGWVVSEIGGVTECILLGGLDEMVTNDDAAIICQFHGGWLVDMDEGRGSAKNNFLKSLISDADGQGGLGDAGMQWEIVEWVSQICHALGQLISPDLESTCNLVIGAQLPAIIDGLVEQNLDPQTVCESIGACVQ